MFSFTVGEIENKLKINCCGKMLRIALLSVVLVCVTGQDVSPAPVKKVFDKILLNSLKFKFTKLTFIFARSAMKV